MQGRRAGRGSTGAWAGVAAGPLLVLSSGIELVVHVQEPDGRVVQPVTFTVLTVLWGLGMACIAVATRELFRRHRADGVPLTRRGRVGGRVLLAGCAFQVAFAVGAGLTAAAAGKPAEAVFLLFAVGFLCLIVGAAMVGSSVRRAGVAPAAAWPLRVSAAAALAAIAVAVDPWHDVALFVFDAAWSGLGVVLLTHRSATTAAPSDRAASVRV